MQESKFVCECGNLFAHESSLSRHRGACPANSQLELDPVVDLDPVVEVQIGLEEQASEAPEVKEEAHDSSDDETIVYDLEAEFFPFPSENAARVAKFMVDQKISQVSCNWF